MMLDGSRRQEELVGNLGVGETLVEALENFGLTGGETGVVTPGCHGAGSLKPLSMCCEPIVSHGVKFVPKRANEPASIQGRVPW